MDDADASGEPPAGSDDFSVTDRETACFELGIKFGSLYHQFAGTPVSPESAPALARAIEASIWNQPFCESVSVEIETDRLASDITAASHDAGYVELTGRYVRAEVIVAYRGVRAVARMAMDDGYPRMRLVTVEERRDPQS